MKYSPIHLPWLVLLLALGLLSPKWLAAQEPQAAQPAAAAPAPPPAPHLADLIPLATALSGRLAKLETSLKSGPDSSEREKSLAEIGASVQECAAALHTLKAAPLTSGGELMSLQTLSPMTATCLQSSVRP